MDRWNKDTCSYLERFCGGRIRVIEDLMIWEKSNYIRIDKPLENEK